VRQPLANSVEIPCASSSISRLPSCARKQGLAWCPSRRGVGELAGLGASPGATREGRRRFKLLRSGSAARPPARAPARRRSSMPRVRSSSDRIRRLAAARGCGGSRGPLAMGTGTLSYLVAGYFLLCGAAGGFFGWYRGTRRLRWRPHHSDRPDNVSAAEHSRLRRTVLRRQRVVTTAVYAALGMALGLALLLLVAHRV